MSETAYTVLIVPGLRDHVPEHWQTHLAAVLPRSRTVPPIAVNKLSRAARVEAIEREACAIDGPLIIAAHSAGVVMVAHWARRTCRGVSGALLATPPDLDWPLPDGYPTMEVLGAGGWLPVPRDPLPFPAVVAASRNDPLARFESVADIARDWGARIEDLGEVGHLNPASGYGPWPRAETIIAELAAAAAVRTDAPGGAGGVRA